jgi:putative phage-type endonuclease
MEQRSEEWFSARRGKITASGFSNMMRTTRNGESTYKTRYRTELAIERLTGKAANETPMNQFMRDGVEREPIARELFIKKTGMEVEECGFYNHPTIDMSGASPDGIIKAKNAVLEIKCPTPVTHANNLLSEKMPNNYRYQVQWQIACAETDKAYFCSYNPNYSEKLQIKVIEVARDDKLISKMEEAARQFNIEVEDLIIKMGESNG